uniref:7-cyano-7-deazaguanine synthase n=1 Tax=Amphimedon queenslandica TaxID=400682 RepID=A0A1X7UAP5_AMPQE
MPKSLAFCGGGKDSLVSMKLLEEIEESYSSLGYSHSLYGQASHQHQLIDDLVKHCSTKSHHHLTVLDEFLSSPIPESIPNTDVKSVKSSETFSALFEALPIALKYGYTQLILGHERCSDKGNLLWSVNDEYINHKWVKTIEAQSILNSYIKQNLISNISYFSFLMPIHDTLIFQSLTRYIGAVPFTHSCNLRKPWCLRCPKCCYVWLGYSAYLPQATVHATFGEKNLLDVEENQTFFIELLGLADQTPFESVGEVDEVQLAFALCRSKGIKGKAMSVFEDKVAVDVFDTQKMNIIDKYTKVYGDNAGIPQPLGDQVLTKLKEFSVESHRAITKAFTA